MNTMKKESVFTLLASAFRLQWRDFPLLGAIVLGCYLLMQLVFGVIVQNAELHIIGIPGVFALAAAVVLSALAAFSRFWFELRMGVRMGMPRRQMALSGLVLSFATGLFLLALAAACNGVWAFLFGRAPDSTNLLAMIPLWGWALALYLPVCLGLLAGGVVLRFGQRGGWVLYAVFMCFCLGPQLLQGLHFSPSFYLTLLHALPLAGPLAGAAFAAFGWSFLRKVAV